MHLNQPGNAVARVCGNGRTAAVRRRLSTRDPAAPPGWARRVCSAVKRGSPGFGAKQKYLLVHTTAMHCTALQLSGKIRVDVTSCLQAPNTSFPIVTDSGAPHHFLLDCIAFCLFLLPVIMRPRLSVRVRMCVPGIFHTIPAGTFLPQPAFLSLRRDLPKQAHTRATENICEVVTQRHYSHINP